MGLGQYHITGGRRLAGTLEIGGGKNAVLPILAACVLHGGESVLHNCPRISDTHSALAILCAIGCETHFEGHDIVVNAAKAGNVAVPESLVREMRAAIIFLGAMLGRFGHVQIGYPGGCELGARPIDLHLKALRQMGADITETHGVIHCKAKGKRLQGAALHLDFPSVGATENILLAAVFAEGETVLTNAAREPEIVDLQNFLNAMGAKVRGAGTGTIAIRGVERLHGAEYTVMPDRIVAGTMLTAAAITGGEVTLTNVVPEDLAPVLAKLAETGCVIREEKRRIHLAAPDVLRPVDCLRTLPHPGFPTDMQSQFMACLCLARGTSICMETVFESRNKHVAELRRMGADIVAQDGQTSIIKGVPKLHGAAVEVKDLRGGAALTLAGLAAEGESVVSNISHIERGYEDFAGDLRALGANISRAEA